MLTPDQFSTYERASNIAAGLCAACAKPLDDEETYYCGPCADEAFIETDANSRMYDENTEEAKL